MNVRYRKKDNLRSLATNVVVLQPDADVIVEKDTVQSGSK
jgi:hypothetical protein